MNKTRNVALVAALLLSLCGAAASQVSSPVGPGPSSSSGGSGVPSIAGTANQITQTGSPGATTLSIPSDFRLPGTINLLTLTQPATGSTLTLLNGKTFVVNNSLTLSGTDSTVMTFPSTSATIARTDAANTFTGVQTFSTPIAVGSVATMTATVGGGVPTPPNNTTTFLRGDGTFATPSATATSVTVGTTTIGSGTNGRIEYNNAGVLGEMTTSGTGTVVCLVTSCALVTPSLGVASATTINKLTITTPATGSTLTVPDGTTLNTGAGGTLASAAFVATGTSGATIPLLNGTNTWSAGQTLSAALTYGGVTLLNSVQGTGSMVLATSPTLTTPVIGAATGTSLSTTGAQTAFSATAIPTGGTAGAGMLLSSTANNGLFFGTGAPTLTAAKGSLYLENGTGIPYYNNNGTTGWTALSGGSGSGTVSNCTTATSVAVYAATGTTVSCPAGANFKADSSGNVTVNSIVMGATSFTFSGGSNNIAVVNDTLNGQPVMAWQGGAIRMEANAALAWTSTNNATGTADTGFSRDSAGVIDVGNGGASDVSGKLKMASLSVSGASVNLPGLGTSSAATTGTVCWTTSTGLINVDTTTTCLLSAAKFKQNVIPLGGGLTEVMAMRPVEYELKPQYDPTHIGRQVGFIADEVQKIDPRLVGLDANGEVHGMRYEQFTAVLARAVQEQQGEIADLKKQLKILQGTRRSRQ